MIRKLSWSVLIVIAVLIGAVETMAQKPAPPPPPATTSGELNTAARAVVQKPWTGDFDGMVKRRRIRILTPYSKTHYFVDKGVQRGLVAEAAAKLESDLNAKLKTGLDNKVYVVVVPTSRDELYPSLVEGRGDIIAASITITPEREKLVDFTSPTMRNTSEVLVTGPGAAVVTTKDDLSGKVVSVRDKSVYLDSIESLNKTLKAAGKPPVGIKALPVALEDEDILEMVNAGLVKATVVHKHIANFWKGVLPSLVVHESIVLRDNADMGWAVRKGSPQLIAALNPLIEANGMGTTFGNIVLRKYLQNTKFVKSATNEAELKKFMSLVEIFRKYGQQYDMDFLLMLAQGYQESQLDHNAKSHVGAIGVMQIMPATGKDLKVGNIKELEPNINGGVKYMRNLIDTYFKNDQMDPLNKGLMAFASYNAGPGKIRTLRKEAERRGLNPNVWFNNVERVVAEKIGRETTTYVSNIYKYYVAYTLTLEEMKEREKLKGTVN